MNLSERMLWQVWERGQIVAGNDPELWRKDEYGAWIFRRDYKNPNSEYGWEVGCINSNMRKPDDTWNLCPLNCKNTRKRDDLNSNNRVTALGIHNSVLLNV